jgi:signal transduction histidine kinase/CheY-like chemotaxis protein
MQARRGREIPIEIEDPKVWRDQLSMKLARAVAVLCLVATLVTASMVEGNWARPLLTAAGSFYTILISIVAITGRPGGRLRAWFILVPGAVTALAAYATVGFLSGPAVVLSLTIMISGILLGLRAMIGLSVILALGLGVIAWAMIHSLLPAPSAHDVSMTLVTPWVRTIVITFLASGLVGGLLIEMVGRIERSLELARSETERREQAERDKANAEIVSLEAKQLETIGRLAAGVAHDFNNNLTTIIGCSELLKEELADHQSALELIEDTLKSAQRAAELTRQLLAFSRRAQMVLVSTDIHQLIENAVSLLRRSIHPRVRVVTRLNAENAVVLADATLLENAILNLLVNAGDAMPEGGELTVATTTYQVADEAADSGRSLRQGTYVLVEVLDTGVGIDSEILPNIFDPFFTTKPVGKGTGLGLAAVSGTIKAHSGSIEVESEPGCGTAFRILLPCSTSESGVLKQDTGMLTPGSGEILLVDDDALVRRTAASTLRNLGYAVTTAKDGIDAVEVFEAAGHDYDLVILDLRMPRMGGEETFKTLRGRAPTMPIVIWSAFGAEQDVAAMLRNGAAGFVQKPYRIAELSLVVDRAIKGKSAKKTRAS